MLMLTGFCFFKLVRIFLVTSYSAISLLFQVADQAHYAMFPRGDVQGMIKYIKENCDLTVSPAATSLGRHLI